MKYLRGVEFREDQVTFPVQPGNEKTRFERGGLEIPMGTNALQTRAGRTKKRGKLLRRLASRICSVFQKDYG